MKLIYHNGLNFGDALNPLIFNHFFPNFFNDDNSISFIGIGSILGLKKMKGKKIIFSTGYAAGDDNSYGTIPNIDDSYKIYCVRGPLTAKQIGINNSFSITDGAVLISSINLPKPNYSINISYIPHHKSLEMYDNWDKLMKKIGISLIDPRLPVEKIISDIRASKLVLCEAMHGAIVADSFRIPWIPIKTYPHINEFKWKDWQQSLEMNYHFEECKFILHNKSFIAEIISKKSQLLYIFSHLLASIVLKYRLKQVKLFFKKLKNKNGYLSDNTILCDRQSKLKKILIQIKKDYINN